MEDLARLSFKRQPLYVGIDDSKAASTREGLEQGYCCVASDKRFLLLFTFLKKNANRKVRRPAPVLHWQMSDVRVLDGGPASAMLSRRCGSAFQLCSISMFNSFHSAPSTIQLSIVPHKRQADHACRHMNA